MSIDAGNVVGDTVGSPSSANITVANTSLPTINDFYFSTGIFEKNSQVTLSVGLDNPTLVNLTLPLTFTGTATNGSDYSTSANSIVIPAGSSTGSITLTGNYTGNNTGTQTIVATLGNLVNVQLGCTTDLTERLVYPPSVSLSLSNSTLSENGGMGNITATLSAATLVDVQVPLVFSGTAINGTNYSASANFIDIQPGNTTGSITLDAINNGNYTGNQTIVASLGNLTNVDATPGNTTQVTATIVNTQAASHRHALVGQRHAGRKGRHRHPLRQPLRAGGRGGAGAAAFLGTAAQGTNYSLSAHVIDIQPGCTSGSITLNAIDTGYTVNETIVASLNSAQLVNATPGNTTQVTATIFDSEPPPVVNLSLSSDSLARNGGSDTLYANLSAPAGVAVTVPLLPVRGLISPCIQRRVTPSSFRQDVPAARSPSPASPASTRATNRSR